MVSRCSRRFLVLFCFASFRFVSLSRSELCHGVWGRRQLVHRELGFTSVPTRGPRRGGSPQSQREVQGQPLRSSAASPSWTRRKRGAWHKCSPMTVGAPSFRERAARFCDLHVATRKSRLHLTTASGGPRAKTNGRSREARVGDRSMGCAESSVFPTCMVSWFSMPSHLERRAAPQAPGAAPQRAPERAVS